jgi:hypothetical protein
MQEEYKGFEYKDLEDITKELGVTLTGIKYDKASDYLQENNPNRTAEWITKGMPSELKAHFSVVVEYIEGNYYVEIIDPKNPLGMNLGEGTSTNFHEAIEQAFEDIGLNDQDYIEASL